MKTRITIDIETAPDMRPGALEAFIQDARENFKAPSTLTKEQAAKDLGMTDKDEIKFTSAASMTALWVERFAKEKAPEIGEENWRKTSLNGACGQLAVAGFAIDDEPPIALFYDDWKNSEEKVIKDLFHVIKSVGSLSPLFIGHNHVGFDLRFLFHRAVILGIQPPMNIPFNVRQWDENVFDTMFHWAGHGNRISLNNLCIALGIEGKGDIDGSKVYDHLKDGKVIEVAAYCCDDVFKTRECYKRMTFQAAKLKVAA